MQPTLVDWILLAILLLYVPLDGRMRYRRMKEAARLGVQGARVRAYRHVLIEEWLLSAAVLALFLIGARPLQLLGLQAPQGRLAWLGVGLSALAVGFLLVQHLVVRGNREHLAEVRVKLGDLAALIPRTRGEANWFGVVSLTAGVCEELLYRGFVMALFGAVMPLPLAFVLCNLAFGLGHLYQGPAGIAKTALVGAVLGGLALLSGSLWPAMLVHAAIDWNSGELGRRALGDPYEPAPATGPISA